MNCKKCVRLIPKFLNHELDTESLRGYLEHIEFCSECKEELTIEFLVKEGLNSLEAGESFDLNRELMNKINNEEQVLFHRENLNWIFYGLSGMVGVAFCVMLVLVLFV